MDVKSEASDSKVEKWILIQPSKLEFAYSHEEKVTTELRMTNRTNKELYYKVTQIV